MIFMFKKLKKLLFGLCISYDLENGYCIFKKKEHDGFRYPLSDQDIELLDKILQSLYPDQIFKPTYSTYNILIKFKDPEYLQDFIKENEIFSKKHNKETG